MFVENSGINWDRVRQDIEEHYFWILEDEPYGDFKLSICYDRDGLVIDIHDFEGEAVVGVDDVSHFLAMTDDEIEKYMNEIIYFNYQHHKDLEL